MHHFITDNYSPLGVELEQYSEDKEQPRQKERFDEVKEQQQDTTKAERFFKKSNHPLALMVR